MERVLKLKERKPTLKSKSWYFNVKKRLITTNALNIDDFYDVKIEGTDLIFEEIQIAKKNGLYYFLIPLELIEAEVLNIKKRYLLLVSKSNSNMSKKNRGENTIGV